MAVAAVANMALERALAAGEQAMLFLTRRGYAPLTLCEACGHKFTCPHCPAWLVEHKYKKRLACHQCGYELPMLIAGGLSATESGTLFPLRSGVNGWGGRVRGFLPRRAYSIASSDILHGPAETQASYPGLLQSAKLMC